MNGPAPDPAAVLHHEVIGPEDGPPLLLVHSIGTSRTIWEPAAHLLADAGVRVVTCDLRGHGATSVPERSTAEAPWTVADLGRDVLGLLDALGLPRAAVAGVSLGGLVAQWLAVDAPERVSHLAVCCSGARFAPASMWHERAATVREQGTGVLADAVIARWFTEAFAARRPEVVAEVRATLEATPAEGYAGAAEVLAAADLRDDLPQITAPTLVLAGAEDPATPPDDHAVPMAAAIQGAELLVLEAASHLAPLERPEATADALLALLERPA